MAKMKFCISDMKDTSGLHDLKPWNYSTYLQNSERKSFSRTERRIKRLPHVPPNMEITRANYGRAQYCRTNTKEIVTISNGEVFFLQIED